MAFIRLLAPASSERRLLPEFLCYCLSREDFVKSELARISGASTRTSLRAVKIRELREFLIPLPPAEKQTAFCELWRKHLERRKAARELEQLREEQIAAAFDSISSI
jgi:restriction endonuclease S subunit